MINLTNKKLPNTVTVGGGFFTINTDFREWLKFDKLIKQDTYCLKDFTYLFPNDFPIIFTEEQAEELIKVLVEFYSNPNSTPRSVGREPNTPVLDYEQDGEYIYSAFMQAYGIDLLEVDMHWHKFKALFTGLPGNCKMVQIMQARSYRKETRKPEKVYEENKRRWELPTKENAVSQEVLDAINEEFL